MMICVQGKMEHHTPQEHRRLEGPAVITITIIITSGHDHHHNQDVTITTHNQDRNRLAHPCPLPAVRIILLQCLVALVHWSARHLSNNYDIVLHHHDHNCAKKCQPIVCLLVLASNGMLRPIPCKRSMTRYSMLIWICPWHIDCAQRYYALSLPT